MPLIAWQISWPAIAVAGLAVLVLLHAWLTHAIRPRRRGRSNTLLALRTAAMIVLALVAFRPTLQLPAPEGTPRRVTVVIDTSASMAGAGDLRSDAELVRLAEAFGDIPTELRDRPGRRSLQELVDVFRALRGAERSTRPFDSETAYRAMIAVRQALAASPGTADFAERLMPMAEKLRAERRPGVVLRDVGTLIADARRRENAADEKLLAADDRVRRAVEPLRGATRFDLARRAVLLLADRLGARAELRLMDFNGDITLNRLRTIKATGDASPLLRVLRGATLDGVGESVVVLFSDGRTTERRADVPPAIAAANVPVYAVATAPQRRQPDVRVLRVEAPAAVFAGDVLSVRVVLRSANAQGRPARVRLRAGAGEPLEQTTLLSGGDDVVAFDLPTSDTARLELAIEALPLANEQELANNRGSTTVDVVERRVRVLLLAGRDEGDVPYLRELFSRTRWCDFSSQVLDDAPCRFTRQDIMAADVILLSDVPAAALSAVQSRALHEAVSAEGRSVVFLGGAAGTFADYASRPELVGLLPAADPAAAAWRQSPGETAAILPVPAKLMIPPPPVMLDPAPEVSLARWLSRPRMFRLLEFGRLKAGAIPLMVDRVSQSPAMIEQGIGAGRALTIAVDETWRWRSDIGAQGHEAFWLSVVRYLLDAPPDASAEADWVGIRLPVEADIPHELADTSPDPNLLRRIADSTGGDYLTLEELPGLIDRLAETPARVSGSRSYAVWCSPVVFALVIGCLGLEWTLRKRSGLA